MGRITDCENVWFRARKKAASYNDKLNSREGASEAIGIAPSTLAEYELGITKCIPPDKAVLMADVYKAPELMSWYCNHECPIGCATAKKPEEVGGIEQVAIALLNRSESRFGEACYCQTRTFCKEKRVALWPTKR